MHPTPLLVFIGSLLNFPSTMDIINCQICGEDYTTCQCLEGIADSVDNQSISGSTSASTTSRVRNWCFTLNNPTQEERDALSAISARLPEFRYMVYQLEEGEEGTQHLQGYIEFQRPMRFNTVKSMISPRVHLERRRGTRDQAREYCMKEDTRIEGPFEFGEWIPEITGFRADLERIRTDVKRGHTITQLWEDYYPTMVRYHKAIERFKEVVAPERDSPPVVHVLYGPTGTGKSKWCKDNFPDAYWKSQDRWWDHYESNHTVIFDEFYGWIRFSELLRICDRYPCLLERKGGFVKFNSHNLIFCSNTKPRDWYKNVPNFDAFVRRVSIWHYLPDIDTHHTIGTYEAFLRLID